MSNDLDLEVTPFRAISLFVTALDSVISTGLPGADGGLSPCRIRSALPGRHELQ